MKKMKRIMAMATAAAMMVSMFAVTAFADVTSANTLLETTDDGVLLKVPVTYGMDSKTLAQELEFDYTLESPALTESDVVSTSQGESIRIKAGPEVTATVEFDSTDTYTASSDGSRKTATKYAEFDLSDLLTDDYGQGVYRYVLSEAKAETSINTSIPASTTTYQLDIYVTYNETSKANEISYVIAREKTESGVGDKLATLGYDHGITGTDLIITSHVEGNFLDTDHLFTYTIDIPAAGSGDTGAVGGVTFTNGKEIPIEIHTLDDDGNWVVTDSVVVVGTTFTQQLKDTEYMVLPKLPVGMIFTVTQTADDDYTTRNTYSFIDETVGSMTKSGTSSLGNEQDYEVSHDLQLVQIYSESNKIDFYNKRDIVVDTGVTVDVLPYALVMVMALCGGILFVSKKRSSVR
jgi:hypothetical protein